MRKIGLILLVGMAACTGRKYPMPTIVEQVVITDSTYIRTAYWDFDKEIRDFQVGPDGLIYILFEDSLKRYYQSMQEEGFALGFSNPISFYVSSDRYFYVLEMADSSVRIFDYDGNPVAVEDVYAITPATGPYTSISADGEGNFFITYMDSSLLLKFNRDSVGLRPPQVLAERGNGIINVKLPWGTAYRSGVVFVASSGNHWVEGLTDTPPVENVIHLGGLIPEPSDSTGRFDIPMDVALDSYGAIYVLEYGNRRFQKFSPSGEFVMVSSSPDSTLIPVAIGVTVLGEDIFVAYNTPDGRGRLEKYNKPQRIGEGDEQ